MVTKKEHVGTKNLKPVTKGSKRARELGRKGGLSKSPAKVLSSRINGMLNNKKLDPEVRYILAKMKDRDFGAAITELISFDAQNIHDDEARRKAIDHLQKFMPTKVMSLNANVNIDLDKDNKEAIEHLEKLFGKGGK